MHQMTKGYGLTVEKVAKSSWTFSGLHKFPAGQGVPHGSVLGSLVNLLTLLFLPLNISDAQM